MIKHLPLLFILMCCAAGIKAQCPAGSTEITLEHTVGPFASEEGWELYDATAMTVVDCVPSGTYPNFNATVYTSGPYCLVDGNSYELYGFDNFGDGWDESIDIIITEDGSVNGCGTNDGTIIIDNGGEGVNLGVPFGPTTMYSCDTQVESFILDLPGLACNFIENPGCTNPLAANYDPSANSDDGSCIVVPCPADAVDAGMDQTVCAGQTVSLSSTVAQNVQTVPFAYTVDDACMTSFVDISGSGAALGISDDGEANIMTVNSYDLYEVSYSEFRIGNNGALICSDAGNVNPGNGSLTGSTSTGAPSLFPLWADWDSDIGNVYWEEQGSVLIVQWDDRPHFSGSSAVAGDGVTFQIQWDSSTGIITFVYDDLDEDESGGDATHDDAATATIGIDNNDGSNFIEYSFDMAQPGLSCLSFSAASGPCNFLAWVTDPMDIAGTTVGNTESIMVSPTTTTTYYAIVTCNNNQCVDEVTVNIDCNASCITPPTIALSEACLDGTVGQCSYTLVPGSMTDMASPQDMAALQSELDGFMTTTYDIDVTDQYGCMQTYTVSKPACDCNATFEPDFMASDPCSCNNDQSANGAGDGTFSETVVVTGTCGFMLFADPTSTPANIAGAMFTETGSGTGTCMYTLNFNHVDGIGYNLCIVDGFGNPVNSTATGQQICFSNVCTYPEINEPDLGPYCASDAAITGLDGLVADVNGNPGDVMVTINGNTTTTLDPAMLGAGMHSVMWTFTGSGTSDSGGTLANPAYPGCETSYTTSVTVEDGPPVAICNPNVVLVAGPDGCATVTAADLDNGSNDPTACTLSTLDVDVSQICCSGPSTTIVTLTATNSAGNTATCTSSITLNLSGVNPPTAVCADITVDVRGNGSASITPSQVDGGSTTPCGAVTLNSVSPNVFDCDDLGDNTYVLQVTDPVTGFSDVCNGIVTIEDNIAPVIICSPDKIVELSPGLCGELSAQPLPFVDDNCEDLLVVEQIGGPINSVDFLDIDVPYTYTFEVTDPGGNTASCSYSVTLIPYQNPISQLNCNDHVNITANLDCEIDFTADMLLEGGPYGCYDSYIVTSVTVPGLDPNTFEVTVTDPNTGISCWGYISVEDKTDPVIDCEICPPVNGNSASDYNPDCVLNCYEQPILQLNYDDGLRDDLIQEDYEDFVEDAVTDNCNNFDEEDVSFYDQYTSLGACVGTRLTRVWTVGFERADGSRGTVSCTREYFFRPLDLVRVESYALDANGNPIFEAFEDALVLPPEIIELPCGVDVSPQGITAFFDDPTSVDRDTDDNNIDPDELDVDLVIENNEGFRWAYPHYYQDGVGSGGPHAQAINNEICNILTGYTDSEIDACAPGCYGNRKVLRNWTVLDWCTAQFVTYGQIIKSIDQNPPSLTVNDVTVSVDPWNCEAAVRLPAPEHISDDCDSDISYYIGNRSGFGLTGNATDGYVLQGVGLGTHTIEYKSEDCCGNVGRTTMTVTVVDNTPPIAVSKEFIVIGLTNIGNTVDEFQGVAKLHAEDVDNGSYDGCSDVTLSIRRTPVCDASDADWGPFVSFCCEDLNGATQANIDVELRILDENGNENIVWATVLLDDKTATIPQMPPHMFLTCDMDYNNLEMTGGIPRFFGACGEAQIDCDTLEVYENTEPDELRASDGVIIDGIGPIEAPAYDPSCGFGAIRRQFRDCGGGVQWFVILPVDPFDSSTIVWPADVVVDCDDYETGEPSWEEATCNLVGVSMEADTFLFEDGACYKILNHWSVINWCTYDPSNPSAGGKYEHTQVIKIIDTVDPVLTVEDSLCFAVTTDCVSSDVNLSGSATDDGDCGSSWISWDVSIDAYADWTEDFHYATTNPRVLPNGDPNPYHIAKTGNGEAATITLPDGIPSSKIWHRSVWRAFDGCGNTSSVTRYFQIVDKKAPTPYCLNLSTAVMSNGQVELWAIDFNVGSFDNCTDSDNLLFTFTDVAPPPRDDTEYDSNNDLMWYNGTFWYYDSTNGDYESQDDYGGDTHRWEPGLRSAGKVFTTADADASGFAQVPIYAWDECGNRDFCLVNLRLVDNGGGGMAMVSGQVVTEFGEEVEQVVTELDGPLNFRETDMTDAQGEYAFTNTPFYADYQVRGEKNDDYLNGVSTLDLIIIQRHILSIESLDSPYKMIAADANSDNEVSALDLIELRKLILGIYDELPNNGSWKFINADNTLSLDNPWNYSETRSIEDLAADMMTEDFVGVKIGDVDGNVIANAKMQGEGVSQAAKTVEISYEDKVVKEGDIVKISFTTERSDIYGYQFTLNTPGLELVEVQGVKSENIAVFQDKLTMSYNETQAIDAGTLVTLVMKAKTSARVSELLDMGSELTQAEAYVGNDLEVVNINLADQQEEGEFALYQNEPNPFSDNTTIGFKLPEAGQANITLYDVTGKVLKVIQGQYERGYNAVRVTKEELGVSGMIYYRLQAGDEVLTKHMILIE